MAVINGIRAGANARGNKLKTGAIETLKGVSSALVCAVPSAVAIGKYNAY